MHILFLTDNFPPEVNAPASRTHEHCRQWVRNGHEVTVITCAPNFPTGRVFDGWSNKLWQQSMMDGIRVIRVWSFITANEGFLRRVMDYVSYMVTATLASLFVRRVDIVIGTSPQFFTAVAGWAVGLVKRVPFIFELRDLWPESIKAVGAMKESRVIRGLERVELFLYRRAARIVSVTHSFRRTLGLRGIEMDKIDVVTNGVDITRFSPRPKDAQLEEQLGLKGCFVAGYIGTHGMAHALETLLLAAQQLQSRTEGAHVRLLMLGDGARKTDLQAQAQQMGLRNVIFVDTVPKEQVARYWSLLDVSIIHLRKTELFTTVIPSKLFECMGMGIPVLHGVQGESADIVRREDVGIPFEPENADELTQLIVQLKADPAALSGYRQRCLASAGHYDRLALADEMLKSLQKAAADSR
ncbi:MAG: glycosyltransferase family 4 protein [Acidovorax sp.]|nr:glycosyltransferase family 4 protein [Acidovorax sp.]